MTSPRLTQPDITLLLDRDGVIREATLSSRLADESIDGWIGRPWRDTVDDSGTSKVDNMVADVRRSRVSVSRQLTQRLPSGRELLMEFTTVRLGGRSGLLAIGRNLQAVADLQTRLVAAQQAMERDYWKLRDIETRYRLLFGASAEAVLLLRASDLRVVDANPAAAAALSLDGGPGSPAVGRDFLSVLDDRDREAFRAAFDRAREQGKVLALPLHLGKNRTPWLVRISLVPSKSGAIFLLQFASTGADKPRASGRSADVSFEAMVEHSPDGCVILDRDGSILRANRAFLDMVQVGNESAVAGERVGRWLARPGADMTVLLANVRRHGVVRLFSTAIVGELGAETEVEISAVSTRDRGDEQIGVLIRDVSRRLPDPRDDDRLGPLLRSLTEQIGKTTLRKLVDDTVAVVEKHYVEAALQLTGGNRTAAADLLGLSRQSLYAKLDRYDLEESTSPRKLQRS